MATNAGAYSISMSTTAATDFVVVTSECRMMLVDRERWAACEKIARNILRRRSPWSRFCAVWMVVAGAVAICDCEAGA